MLHVKIINAIKNDPVVNRLAAPLRKFVKKQMEKTYAKHPLRNLRFKHKMYYGRSFNLDNPRSLCEKLAILEFCTDTSDWTEASDKVAVRRLLEKRGFGEYLVPVVRIFEDCPSYEEFAEAVTDGCVAKTSHSGGGEGVFLIRDKKSADLKKIYRGLVKSLHDDYATRTTAPHYKGIKPRIIIEKMLLNDENPDLPLNDYKFFCLNGEPVFINALGNRNLKTHTVVDQFYDLDMNRFDWEPQNEPEHIKAPKSLKKMTELARELAQPYTFVRVDFYEVDGKPYFGELTFAPGLDFFLGTYGEEVLHLGDRLDISNVPRIRRIDPSWF